ncbi:MAG TPA: hypothetical protein VJK53_00260 [Candidatus Paceibacterota bacterium]
MGALDRAGRFAKKAAVEVGKIPLAYAHYLDHKWNDPTIGPRLEAQRKKTKESFRKLGAQTKDTVFTRILGGMIPLVGSMNPFSKLTAEQRGRMMGKAVGEMVGGVGLLVGRILLTGVRTSEWALRHAIGH